MKYFHDDLEIHLDDAWWAEAGMSAFARQREAYRASDDPHGRKIFFVGIRDIGPVRRNPGVGIFNNNEELTARQRVLRILRGFRADDAIPPIELVKNRAADHPFKLTAGTHRLYCSLAVGFNQIPAVEGFDITDPHA